MSAPDWILHPDQEGSCSSPVHPDQEGRTFHFELCRSTHLVDGRMLACTDDRGHSGACGAYVNAPGGRRLVTWMKDDTKENRDA